jgi:alkylated DNA nucleotide flippase Atl1
VGEGTLVIPSPLEVYEMMAKVPEGKVVTISEIRSALAKKHGATIGCPLTTGIFALGSCKCNRRRGGGKNEKMPYWRTLKSGGEINEKYPGGIERQKLLLEAEGHRVLKKGRKYVVANFNESLYQL